MFEIVYLHLNVEELDLHLNEYCINLVFVVLLKDLIEQKFDDYQRRDKKIISTRIILFMKNSFN